MTNLVYANDIRRALAATITKQQPDAALNNYLTSREQTKEQMAEADKVIIAYLNKHSAPVFGRGARFFLPVSAKFGDPAIGDALVYSDGERAGKPMKEDGLQVGVKFRNGVDGIEQAVRGDGQGVIVIGGEMTAQKASFLYETLHTLTGGTGNPEDLTLMGIDEMIKTANSIGLNDIWTGKHADVLKATPVNGAPVAEGASLKALTGHFVHKPQPGKEVAALHVRGGAQFRGDVAGGMQEYSQAPGFYVTIGIDRKGVSQYRGIAEEPFTRDYVDPSNRPCHQGMFFSFDAQSHQVKSPPSRYVGMGNAQIERG